MNAEPDYDGYPELTANDIEAFLALDGVTEDELETEFGRSAEYMDAFATYAEDFRFSADYELAYQRWLHERIEDQ